MKEIKSLEEWNMLASRLSSNGWSLRQWQYSTDSPEGFHAWFWKPGKHDYEVVTHNDAVHDAIIKHKPIN